jgi:hypothetical protein
VATAYRQNGGDVGFVTGIGVAGWGFTRTSGAAFSCFADSPALATVLGIGLGIDTCAATEDFATTARRRFAGPAFACFTSFASRATLTAVFGVCLCIDTGTIAIDFARFALALSSDTGGAIFALLVAVATVISISQRIDTRATTDFFALFAIDFTATVSARFTGSASNATFSTVLVVGLGVDACATAVCFALVASFGLTLAVVAGFICTTSFAAFATVFGIGFGVHTSIAAQGLPTGTFADASLATRCAFALVVTSATVITAGVGAHTNITTLCLACGTAVGWLIAGRVGCATTIFDRFCFGGFSVFRFGDLFVDLWGFALEKDNRQAQRHSKDPKNAD